MYIFGGINNLDPTSEMAAINLATFESEVLKPKSADDVWPGVVESHTAIVDEAKKENYGTVVIGRRGASKAFFMGSVSRYVLDRFSNRALWLVS